MNASRYTRREVLTRREREVLALWAQGQDRKQIARALCVSPQTVHNHIAHAYLKTGCANAMQLLGWCLRAGVVSAEELLALSA